MNLFFIFILANLHILALAVLVAFPFYFFNRYLVQKIRPEESGKKLLGYFVTVILTALAYSIAVLIIIVWIARCIQ